MPALTDVPGVMVGHAHDSAALTGCTVILTSAGATAGFDVRGGAPGTRETDLLAPEAMVQQIHAIALCGGSAFGLAAATGVVEWLRERNIGFDTGLRRVPIVPAAVIFDLAIGSADRWADAPLGYAAAAAAGTATREGCVGVGAGSTAGKLLGPASAMKTGVGTWSETLVDGTVIGALAVCNALGDLHSADDGRLLAGARAADGSFPGALALLRSAAVQQQLGDQAGRNTTLAVVATDALLDKAGATILARMAQTALPRTIRPVHTPYDGDIVFALATGRRPAPPLAVLGAIAASVLARAIERSATAATSAGGLLAYTDLR